MQKDEIWYHPAADMIGLWHVHDMVFETLSTEWSHLGSSVKQVRSILRHGGWHKIGVV